MELHEEDRAASVVVVEAHQEDVEGLLDVVDLVEASAEEASAAVEVEAVSQEADVVVAAVALAVAVVEVTRGIDAGTIIIFLDETGVYCSISSTSRYLPIYHDHSTAFGS